MSEITHHPLLRDIPFDIVVGYVGEFIGIVGTPPSFEEKTEIIKINDYRGILPCDYFDVIQIRMVYNDEGGKAFRYSTDSFHSSTLKKKPSDFTYKIQGSCIITSVRDCTIELAYKAIPVDDDGYPLLPDNDAFIRAVKLYIKMQWFTELFEQGKITMQVLDNTQRQYAWAVGQAQTDLIRPTIDQMEAISNMWNKFLPDVNKDHDTGYIHEGAKEHIIIH